MGRLRTETEIKTKVINVSKNTEFSVEIMSALQQGISAETIWFTVGGCIGIQQTTILLAGLCEYQRNLGEIINGKTQGCARIDEIEVRKMFKLLESTRSSQRFQLSEQCAIKLRNVMSELSQISAFKEICQSVASFSGSPLAHGAASRMGRLRAYGNAINAEQAKIFIECLM